MSEQFGGKIGKTIRESTPWWPEELYQPPVGKPNVVMIVLDDVGFAQLGCYGSDIDTPNMDRLAWDKPLLTAFSDSDPVTRGGERPFQKLVPGAKGQSHTTITQAGHFLQEDKGEEFAEVVVEFMRKNA